MNKNYTYNIFDENVVVKLAEGLKSVVGNQPTVFLCVGSIKVTGDSVAPLVGTLLNANNFNGFVYGGVNCPITAKQTDIYAENVKKLHPNSKVVAIDSAVGDISEIGQIKLISTPLTPGLAVRKDLKRLGDISLMGVVASRSQDNCKALSQTAFSLVSKMADVISSAVTLAFGMAG